MRILPIQTSPPTTPIRRRHQPRPSHREGGYRDYRACIRWDFGFTCALCLVHESDLGRGAGIERTGLTQFEHRIPQSQSSRAQQNDYGNLLYSCKYCNRARGPAPLRDGTGRRLLDPTADAWADHFTVVGNELQHRDGDADAEYTSQRYGLNDPVKVDMRQWRAQRLTDRLDIIREGPDRRNDVLRIASSRRLSGEERENLLRIAEELDKQIARAWRDLKDFFGAIPDDAARRCRCATTDEHTLPDFLAAQVDELSPPSD